MTDCRNQTTMEFSTATRKTDPDTSRDAEEKITTSGKRKNHCEIIYDALKICNGSTTKELAFVLDGELTYDQIWRRMNDLAGNGLIRRDDTITRDGNCTWWIL